MIALQALFHGIAQAKDEQTLRSHISTELSEYFSATRCGLFLFTQISLVDSKIQKALRLALSPEHNPVARYLIERHAPVHEALVVEPKTWQLICPRADHRHVMAGPIVSNGELVGVIGFTREQGMPAFDSQNLTDLSALCLHISSWVAMGRAPQLLLQTERLTPREMQIASLVAQGQTNAEIGTELWITENSVKQALKRMFRKLEVSSRAQMVAKLAAVAK
ncbi:LuxR C-terminal-related transcriptional regulator [Calothrix sp. PCC 7507]|uniref:LuxR C-terminal-related transcriptional regulator n=1 Tax=Calothrix sp. PCC 7507 TaxID=99598 RepID=UPI00029ECC75|nr:LuxR C-terminal-related transcriptional regulator [Calothrix sp. PCC 7507]AFY32224.1 GAF modulated transcriptional regulator, LuxR family [Calothrix sp. PCC 7507]